MNPNSDDQWSAINGIIRSIDTRTDLQFQTTDIYYMKHIPPSKKKCTYGGMYCVKYCYKMAGPYCIGCKFQ